MKFKYYKKENNEIQKTQLQNENIVDLNKKYNEIISKYTSSLVVDNSINDLISELELLKEEVSNRLIYYTNMSKEYDQKYNQSVLNNSDFNLDEYKYTKDETFKLDSLYRTICERLSAMQETVGRSK